ncbi:multidrug ABC transporter [Niastella vici]|uniref:Multidrug ABC transporter n=1 Tax=Niastella vici TaxID=1703345 RepID=A0A1V9FRW8_9BACT|nr:ABC transporter ATP-binding protein [Niastella vici]OQP61092.1 multidrug ABC transporter [Niastella vici]
MNYDLNKLAEQRRRNGSIAGLGGFIAFFSRERKILWLAIPAILTNAALNLAGSFLIGYSVDQFIQRRPLHEVWKFPAVLLIVYLAASMTSYLQTRLMGTAGQRILFSLRNTVFQKLQTLPVDFFHANRAGDIVARVNNDTESLNHFISGLLTMMIACLAAVIGACICMLFINFRLGLAGLVPAVLYVLFVWVISPLVKRKNAAWLEMAGQMSAAALENFKNFKFFVAHKRRDYFRKRMNSVLSQNYTVAMEAGALNNIFFSVYAFFSAFGQLIVLVYGLSMVAAGGFSTGLLISYLIYSAYLYNALRIVASFWPSLQIALAAWDRVNVILSIDEASTHASEERGDTSGALVEFRNVHFTYEGGKEVLRNVSFRLQRGKNYAFVGPTGGGKTTTASLIARLYDPTRGSVWLNGRDIRNYAGEERCRKIGFILQEPVLFTGTVRENISYGNPYILAGKLLEELLEECRLTDLLNVFKNGLDTEISPGSDSISLGQRQLVSFIRAVLRNPEVLILDEATANIDPVTERLLETILDRLPGETTRITIAHRLNTIKNADEVFFINAGEIYRASSFNDAVNKLLTETRVS